MQVGGLSRCDYEGIIWEYINQAESDFFYHEIFVGECYIDGGITITDGDTIVDAGSNIGLFSLFCLCRADNIKLYSIEPIPPLFEVLQRNMKSYMKRNEIILVKAGLGDHHQDDVEFHYFCSSPGESTRHLIERKAQQDILNASINRQLLRHKDTRQFPQDENLKRRAGIDIDGEEFDGDSFDNLRTVAMRDTDGDSSENCVTYTCALRTLPEIMAMGPSYKEAIIESKSPHEAEWIIDLLKVFSADACEICISRDGLTVSQVDVEGDEITVLRGIAGWINSTHSDNDEEAVHRQPLWPRIRQIVLGNEHIRCIYIFSCWRN